MKNVILSFAVLTSVLASSCKKENEVTPQSSQPAEAKTINIEYKIESESANIEVSYLFPNAEGKLEVKNETVTRSEYSVAFSYKSGNLFSVEAYNVIAARKRVNVQLYVDGKLMVESTSESASQKAIASGNY
jgi:hypothetical protein